MRFPPKGVPVRSTSLPLMAAQTRENRAGHAPPRSGGREAMRRNPGTRRAAGVAVVQGCGKMRELRPAGIVESGAGKGG